MNDRIMFSDLLEGLQTANIDNDLEIETVYCLIKASNKDDVAWMLRSGGGKISSEELLGMLESLCHSIREDLKDGWG